MGAMQAFLRDRACVGLLGVVPCWKVLGLAGLGLQRLGLGYPLGGLQNSLTWGLKFGLEMGLSLAHQKNEIKYEKCT